MDQNVQDYLLRLAKNAIAAKLELGVSKIIRPENADILNQKRGAFVTIDIDEALRGCIGNISPIYPLEEAVKRNAVNAAFEDPRFWPLTPEEFRKINIEISVLTVPEKLKYSSSEDLLKKLRPLKDGVILRKGYYEATYLPQVWEEIADKEVFLASLCNKAGMNSDEWKKAGIEVLTYQAEVF